ncbi:hypothetical protein [Paenibacillus thalictri]|uniref:RDD domain-containing protein n=1 Tax=Paenibacillus thalictri TaxID=2527873 RepID=A0A4Q9DM15_9BACL|nr:hypothetical protein [Paenibacillus thalictri]TBL74500.1 hypothetical protein EYB31_24535 [Paenibacillus thalictri]
MEEAVNTKNEVPIEIAKTKKPRPWIRYLARYFDVLTHSILLGIIWALIDEESLDRIDDKVLSLIFLFIWIFVEGIYVNANLNCDHPAGVRSSKK